MMRTAFCVVLTSLALLTGCDDPFIDPFEEGRHFTIYGYLSEFDHEHFVRVVPVRRFPESIPNEDAPHAEIDGRVTSVDLTTGEEHSWLHQLVQLDDGNLGHVFGSTFVVRRGHRYRLTVTRSDGATSTAETRVPNLSSWHVGDAVIVGDSTSQLMTWVGASTPELINMVYCAKPVGGFSCSNVVVPYRRSGRRTSEGWEVTVLLSRDLLYVRQQIGVPDVVILELSSMDMLFTVLDDKWVLPEEPYDPIQFAQPDALTNVENGFGFWGSVSRSGANWLPSVEALEVSGYVRPNAQSSSESSSSSARKAG